MRRIKRELRFRLAKGALFIGSIACFAICSVAIFASSVKYVLRFKSLPRFVVSYDRSASAPKPAIRKRHALLVGVWNYDRGRGPKVDWWNLHANRDVEAVTTELKTDYGFTDSDIVPLTSVQETQHKSISEAFKNLIKETNEGDIVYFQFSGHGQQLPNTEELDGYTESLIPSDYISQQDGSNNILNKEIRGWLRDLKGKKPGSVTLIFDSCFSGDLARDGRHLVRGAAWHDPSLSDEYVSPYRFLPVPLPFRNAETRAKDATGILLQGDAEALGYVVISASRYDSTAQETDDDEGKVMGLLSYALVKALAEAKPSLPGSNKDSAPQTGTTYRDLVERITDLMTEKRQNQIPVIAGDKDRLVLDGTVVIPKPFVLVDAVHGQLVLNAGSLHGMTSGSVFALYPPEVKHPENMRPRAVATIKSVELARSQLELTDDFKGKIDPIFLDRSRGYERDHMYGENGLKVYVDQVRLPAAVSQKLQKLSVIRQLVGSEDKWDVRIRPQAASDNSVSEIKWVVERDDGSVMAKLEQDDQLYSQMRSALEGEARWRAIKSLTNRDERSPVKVSLQIIPIEVIGSPLGQLRPDQIGKDRVLEHDSSGQIILRDGTYVRFAVENTGTSPAWVTILNLSNSGKVHPVFPVNCENKAVPGQSGWKPLPPCAVAKISNPSNRLDNLKLIATTEYVDLTSFLDEDAAKGAPSIKGPLSSLAELLRAATLGQRAAGNEAVNPTSWYTDSISFIVAPHE
jgi:hypothetical protein